ncbi:CLUMA_CG010574, isoform A [Clunio marinus]|uniref:CLUMA_CG010574, isoform A n=1 Tax=Clunio marinus TaxID=568069 RepID=A0A1J1IFE5_9DIPT|nr:CLUMA_CG010574, isoform A [Clunio marinus]
MTCFYDLQIECDRKHFKHQKHNKSTDYSNINFLNIFVCLKKYSQSFHGKPSRAFPRSKIMTSRIIIAFEEVLMTRDINESLKGVNEE